MTTVLTQAVARLLLGPILMVAAAILVKGYADVGDGFSAGVVAAIGFLLQDLAFGRRASAGLLPTPPPPLLIAGGLALGVGVGFWPLAIGEPPFTHLPGPGAEVTTIGTIELITAVAFDVAVMSLVLGAVLGIVHALADAAEGADAP